VYKRQGLSRFVPFNVSGQSGATPYLFRSGFNAGISFCEDIRSEDYPREMLEQAIAEGKRIRKYYFGDLYALTEVTVDPMDWLVLQYHRPAEQDGIVVAFRRSQSLYTGFALNNLRGIDLEAEYEITVSHEYIQEVPVHMQGAAWMDYNITIPERPGSVIVEYRRIR